MAPWHARTAMRDLCTIDYICTQLTYTIDYIQQGNQASNVQTTFKILLFRVDSEQLSHVAVHVDNRRMQSDSSKALRRGGMLITLYTKCQTKLLPNQCYDIHDSLNAMPHPHFFFLPLPKSVPPKMASKVLLASTSCLGVTGLLFCFTDSAGVVGHDGSCGCPPSGILIASRPI